jgi:Rieske Fe-S protein
MIATGTPRRADRRPAGRLAVALAAVGMVALGGVIAVSAWQFIAPPDSARSVSAIRLAPAADFPLGSVSAYRLTAEGVVETVPDARIYLDSLMAPSARVAGTGFFYVVRLPDGDFRVLSARSTHLGGLVVWDTSGTEWAPVDYVGVFIEPAHSEQWTIDGTRIFGPAPRDLDRYEWHIDGAGILVVDLSKVVPGANRTGMQPAGTLPPPYDVTSEGWPTSGWPSGDTP